MTFNPQQFLTVVEYEFVTPNIHTHANLEAAIDSARETSARDRSKRVTIYRQVEGCYLPGICIELGSFVAGDRISNYEA